LKVSVTVRLYRSLGLHSYCPPFVSTSVRHPLHLLTRDLDPPRFSTNCNKKKNGWLARIVSCNSLLTSWNFWSVWPLLILRFSFNSSYSEKKKKRPSTFVLIKTRRKRGHYLNYKFMQMAS
jgi:hypothetical protein